MNSLSVLGKYLDQPRLVHHFSKSVPAILVLGGAAYTYEHVKHKPEKEKQKEFVKSLIVLAATISSALVAPKIAAKLTKKVTHPHLKEHTHIHIHEHHEHGEQHTLKEITANTTKLVDNFLHRHNVSEKTAKILNEAKDRILKPSEIRTVFEELQDKTGGKEFLSGEHGLIPNPENIDSKHIFGEIGRISILGLIPVLGGMTGGVVADKVVGDNWKENFPNKVKEGSYQYLANIFLCNIGAGGALAAMEKMNITSKPARATGMIGGIILTGLVLGSAVANAIGKVFIDPLFEKTHKHSHQHSTGLYSERKPEALDAGLHIDDVATVAVMSGLKWIEPALPILYSISGYRAGIGYRNGDKSQ